MWTRSQWELDEPGPAPHWPGSTSQCVKGLKTLWIVLPGRVSVSEKAAGFLVIVGKSETSSITTGWCLRWNSAEWVFNLWKTLQRYLTYIWSRVWPRVVFDDGSTPAVSRYWKLNMIHPLYIQRERESPPIFFFLLTKVSLLFLESVAQPVTTICENVPETITPAMTPGLYQLGGPRVNRKPHMQTKDVQTSLHWHCWWKSAAESYHRRSRMQHLCIICFTIQSLFLFCVSYREDWMMSQGNPLWRSTQDVLHIR